MQSKAEKQESRQLSADSSGWQASTPHRQSTAVEIEPKSNKNTFEPIKQEVSRMASKVLLLLRKVLALLVLVLVLMLMLVLVVAVLQTIILHNLEI